MRWWRVLGIVYIGAIALYFGFYLIGFGQMFAREGFNLDIPVSAWTAVMGATCGAALIVSAAIAIRRLIKLYSASGPHPHGHVIRVPVAFVTFTISYIFAWAAGMVAFFAWGLDATFETHSPGSHIPLSWDALWRDAGPLAVATLLVIVAALLVPRTPKHAE